MTKTHRLVRFTALGALAAGLLMAQGPGPARMGMGGHSGKGIEFLATYLGLTEAQKTQVKGILESAWETARPLLPQLKQGSEALAAAVKSGNASDQQLQQLADSQAKLVAQLIVIRAKATGKACALLTAEQRDKAGQLRDLIQSKLRRRFGG